MGTPAAINAYYGWLNPIQVTGADGVTTRLRSLLLEIRFIDADSLVRPAIDSRESSVSLLDDENASNSMAYWQYESIEILHGG